MNNIEALREFFIECERRFPVAGWQHEGIDLWPLLRIELRFYLTNKRLLDRGESHVPSRSKLSVGWAFLKRMARNFKLGKDRLNDDLSPRDVLFFTGGIGYVDYFGKAYEKFCDPFAEELEKHGLSSIRFDQGGQPSLPRFTKSYPFQRRVSIYLLRRLPFFSITPIDVGRLKGFADFRAYCLESGAAAASLDEQFLGLRLRKVILLKKYFAKALEKVQPKLVLITNYYNDFSFALINACREKGIITADVQHGVQGEYHTAYGHWTNVPNRGFNVLPDYFWCWSDEEAEVISSWGKGVNTHLSLPGGNMFLGKFRDASSTFVGPFLEKYQREAMASPFLDSSKKTILVTLQTGIIGGAHMKGIVEAYLTTKEYYNWMFRLHPAMKSDRNNIINRFRELGLTNAEFTIATDTNLYVLLHFVDLHITHSSSVVLEAEQYGISSIVTSSYGKRLYLKGKEKPLRLLAMDETALAKRINELLRDTIDIVPVKKNREVSQKLFMQLLQNAGLRQ